jgi:hypothetical protein
LSYALVWNGPKGFSFDGRQPYSFFEVQFSPGVFSRLQNLDLVLPKQRPKRVVIDRWPHNYFFDRSKATLILANGTNAVRNYDLLDDIEDRDRYIEILKEPDTAARVSFARYDAVVVKDEREFNCCLTLENSNETDTSQWEFAINLPVNLMIEERALIWMARNHSAEELAHRIDFKQFSGSLAQVLTQPSEPVSL